MNKKLRVLVNAIDNIIEKYPETKGFIDNNMKEVCEDSGRVNLFYRVERCLPIAKILENLRA